LITSDLNWQPFGISDWHQNCNTYLVNVLRTKNKLPLRSLTMHGAVSKEITEIIWICNVMGFFFKFGKKIEENIVFNI
jgi:hypothetical protein